LRRCLVSQNQKKEKLEKDPIQIFMSVYIGDEKDGYIYLLGLLEQQDVKILKDQNLNDAISIFQEYCNGGLSIIKSWLYERHDDIDGTDTLVDNIFEQILSISSDETQRGKLSGIEF
jgi:dnd system-associated protein 4